MYKYKSSGDVVVSDKGTITKAYANTTENPWISLSFANDGDSTITITVGEMDIDILSGETFDENFEPFSNITITIASTGIYRLMLRS